MIRTYRDRCPREQRVVDDPTGASRRQEAEPNLAMRIVGVEVNQYNGLPWAQGGTTPEHGEGDRGAYERGEDVVGPVTRRTVGVSVSVVTREQPVQSVNEICFGTRTRLHEREPSRGVGHKHVDEACVISAAKSLKLFRDIDHPVL
jgi:hypothetical protein